jgi:hypothetical protein
MTLTNPNNQKIELAVGQQYGSYVWVLFCGSVSLGTPCKLVHGKLAFPCQERESKYRAWSNVQEGQCGWIEPNGL